MADADLLPGVPWIESPFFAGSILPNADPEHRRIAMDLHRSGFAVIDFPEPGIAALADRMIGRARGGRGWWLGRSKGLPRPVPEAWRKDDDARRIAANARMIGLLGSLYGRSAFPFASDILPDGAGPRLHSDAVLFGSVPERFVCSVHLALEDMDDGEGALVCHPGSHRWPIYVNEHLGRIHDPLRGSSPARFEPLWHRLVEAHRSEPVRVPLRKGQAAICAANLLYRQALPGDPARTFWMQRTRYYFADCCYHTPMLSDPGFGSIAFQTPVDISTGEERTNVYGGMPVDPGFIASVEPRRGAPLLPDGFNGKDYLAANPDVVIDDLGAGEHYLTFGLFEGRRLALPVVRRESRWSRFPPVARARRLLRRLRRLAGWNRPPKRAPR